MHAQGRKIRKIAKALGCSRNTVRAHLRNHAVPDPEEGSEKISTSDWAKGFDWEKIAKERNCGVTAKQLYQEYAPQVSYSQFGRYLVQVNKRKQSSTAAPALAHNPGEKTQVDYADGLLVIDPRSGKKRKTQLFCGVLPFSSYTYAEFSESQKKSDFIRSHERMWAYFGGITPYIIVDNLKSGVTKAHRYDPDLNPTYCDYANHTGFAVLPARPYTPRDKAAVEAAIGVIQRSFYQKYRATTFYSLAELNLALRVFLDDLNAQIMTDYGVSRADRFATEKPLLIERSSSPYEISEFKDAKVHPDCCIQIAKALYSVPFNYVGQTLRVKITDKMIVIFDKTHAQIAVHLRQPAYGRAIEESHLPPQSQQIRSFDVIKAKAKAEAIGERTKEFVDWQFDDERPLRVLRRIQGVLRLHDAGTTREAMEYAASQALQFKRRELRYFSNCAKYFSTTGGRPRLVDHPIRDASTLHLRGEN
jgi:transposase